MVYVTSIAVVVLALVVLGLVLWPIAAAARRFAGVRARVTTDVDDRTRMIAARTAALRVRWQQRGT